ncbi:MAG: alpha/beta hydrolase [Bacteroidetes bacterium]|nr:alpha/beta hydrolase [Bacteroidota bacterium]
MLLALKILFLIAAGYGLLLLVLPKGIPLYEGLRLPQYLFRLKWHSRPDHLPVKHRFGEHPRQYLLHYPPAIGSPEKKAVFIYYHGSGWQFSKPEMFRPNAQVLTARGYHVFMPSHRRIPFSRILELRQDTLSAILKVRELLREQGLPDKKIILAGNSSGGNLSALIAFDRSLLAGAGLSQEVFQAVALLGSPLDLSKMWPSPPRLMVAGPQQGSLFPSANPILHLQPGEHLPTLILHGSGDGIVEYRNSVSFFEKMRELGAKDVQFETLPGGTHLDSAGWGFEGHPSQAVLFKWLERIENQ